MGIPRGLVLGLGVACLAVAGAGAVLATTGEPEATRSHGEAAPPATSAPTVPPGPAALLPDLRSVDAADLVVVRAPDGGRVLRFSASLANDGPGPLVLRPLPPGPDCPGGQHPAVQVVFRDAGGDGAYRRGHDRPLRSRSTGCMLRHPGHDHWHFDAMASYALRAPVTGDVVAARPKVSFCLRDNRRVRGVATTVRREHFGECSRTGRQGISPGWVDVYPNDLPGQSLRLPRAADRRWCLDLVADPRGLVDEADETDNGSSVGIVVDGLSASRDPRADCD
jgi:hypothetical protein